MMKAVRPRIKFTYEDYKSLPESETKRYELLGGDLVLVPPPPVYHQRVLSNLMFVLYRFVKEWNLGEVYHAPLDVVLGEGDEREVVQPDIFFISKEREKIIAEEEIRGAPDLVIEITSPPRKIGTDTTRRPSMPAMGSKNTGSWIPRRKLSKSIPWALKDSS